MIALPVGRMAACQDFAHDLVDGKAVHLRGADTGVTGQPALGAPEAGKVTPADARREEAQQNLPVDE